MLTYITQCQTDDQSLQMHTPSKRPKGIIITELIKILYWVEMFPRKVLVSEGMIYDWQHLRSFSNTVEHPENISNIWFPHGYSILRYTTKNIIYFRNF